MVHSFGLRLKKIELTRYKEISKELSCNVKFKLIVISRKLISFFKDYHQMSFLMLIITELPRIYGKDINYKIKVNTKFLNSLPSEWSKFMTDVKLVRDLHTTNFDQLHAYLEQHELHANKVCIMRELHQDACPQPHSIPQIEYTVSSFNQQTHLAGFPQIDSGLVVYVFKQGDDPIDAINKMMLFLSTVVTSRFTTTNNQLRNSSNPRQQATIHDGRVNKGSIKFYGLKAQGSCKVLNDEKLEFLTDLRDAEGLVTQTVITYNASYQADDLDAYDSDCDDFSTAKAFLMANLSS
ncbi:hypothetical protein Tco_0488370 [Tanacetum coccineum]